MNLDCEVLIVGSGAGGSAVANVLTKAGLDVLMLEEGGYVRPGTSSPYASEAFNKSWRCGGATAVFGKPAVSYAEGRGLGGGTEINAGIFQKPSMDMIDEWAFKYQIDAFSSNEFFPFLDRAFNVVNASQTVGELGRPSDILRDGAAALGWETKRLERAQRHCVGTNVCAMGCPTTAKQSMAVTLLPASVAQGLRIISQCRVVRIIRKGSTVTGVIAQTVDANGRSHKLTVTAKSIFVCAGAIHTPALLQRSDFGRRFGSTLQMHPTIKAIGIFDELVDAHLNRLPLYAVTEFMPNERIGGSLFSPALFAMALAEDWQNRAGLWSEWRHAGMYYGMIKPAGSGKVIASKLGVEPIVRYTHGAEDMAALARIEARLVKVLFAAGAKLVVPSIFGHKGWADPKSAENELANGVPLGRTNLMTIHLFSSCRPGEKRDLTVTDSFGRVRGVSNLFIADASQIPEAPGCNPQASVMAIGFRAAEAYLSGSHVAYKRAAFAENQ